MDYVGLSFVRTAEDVRTAKRELAGLGGDAPVIAKIETRSALDHIDEILAEADGVMVARGDLSIETAFTRVPMVQKVVIAEANGQAKPAITASPPSRACRSRPMERRISAAPGRRAISQRLSMASRSSSTTSTYRRAATSRIPS